MKPVWLLLISVGSATLGQIFFKKGVFMTGEITLKGSVIGELIKLVFNPLRFFGIGPLYHQHDRLAHCPL